MQELLFIDLKNNFVLGKKKCSPILFAQGACISYKEMETIFPLLKSGLA